jgi:hypothetical protein
MQIKDLIEKLSSYNLFNYLFPGYVFASILEITTKLLPRQVELKVLDFVIIYFVGLVISRIGSLIIEGTLLKHVVKRNKRLILVRKPRDDDKKLIEKIDTGKLLEAFKSSIKLEIIHEAMNMYRTLAAGSLILVFFTVADLIKNKSNIGFGAFYMIAELAISILFIFAFCKQRQKVIECL